MSMHDRLKRLELAERQLAPASGLAVFACLVAIASHADRDVPLLAIEVTIDGERVRYDKQPGETAEALHARANPRGSWRLHPTPVMGPME